jgi:hypothetical protein
MTTTYAYSHIGAMEDRLFGIQLFVGVHGIHRRHHRSWTGYKFQQMMRWKWYFDYQAALLKVANPKQDIEMRIYDYIIIPQEEIDAKRLRNKIIANKGKLTAAHNKIKAIHQRMDAAKLRWNQLFPIEESPAWLQAVQKCDELHGEIEARKLKIAQMTNHAY